MCSILFWNAVALEANKTSFTNGKMEQPGPTLSSRALAIVHLAMYDAYAAYNAAAGAAYMPGLPAPVIPPGSTPATIEAMAGDAVSAAAYYTLQALYPSQKDYFDAQLSNAGGVLEPGHSFGRTVALALLADRKNDPGASAAGYVPSTGRGKHKVDPENPAQGFHAPFYGAMSKGFAITDRWEIAAPPFDNAGVYRSALDYVRGKGIRPELMGTLPHGSSRRNENETVVGLYWAYDGAYNIGTPPRFYNQIIRRLAIAKNNTCAENARLFALVNVAMADAGILAWDQKYVHNFWRPVAGIREHDESMGIATQAKNTISSHCDSEWLPLGAPTSNALTQYNAAIQANPTLPNTLAILGGVKNFTPNFPAYPSGHATFGSAALHIARLFYGPAGVNRGGVAVGDRAPDTLFNGLDMVSEELNGVTQDNKGTVRPRHVRSFQEGLWKMIIENGYSRVFLGVHWLFDAFAADHAGNPDLSQGLDAANAKVTGIGGVPLGLKIAEDIFTSGMDKSSVGPRV